MYLKIRINVEKIQNKKEKTQWKLWKTKFSANNELEDKMKIGMGAFNIEKIDMSNAPNLVQKVI